MGWAYDDYFEDIGKLDCAELLHIFTNVEAKPKNEDCTWFYKMVSDLSECNLNQETSGKATLCGCEECKAFGAELFEYFSVYLALEWVKNSLPDVEIWLWVSSEKFLFDENKSALWNYDKIYNCAFLRTLGKDLSSLLSELKVEISHYSYANKELIPTFF